MVVVDYQGPPFLKGLCNRFGIKIFDRIKTLEFRLFHPQQLEGLQKLKSLEAVSWNSAADYEQLKRLGPVLQEQPELARRIHVIAGPRTNLATCSTSTTNYGSWDDFLSKHLVWALRLSNHQHEPYEDYRLENQFHFPDDNGIPVPVQLLPASLSLSCTTTPFDSGLESTH